MCGLNGIFIYSSNQRNVDKSELMITRDHMRARGPDSAGIWTSSSASVGLGHRRLSIIDLSSAADQPMVSGDGRYVVVFNGEIYNYIALRKDLKDGGYDFRTDSDTEVILHLFGKYKENMLEKLRGMFSIAIWDGLENRLFLARDSYGIKPLYYSDDGKAVRFASSVKALLAGGAIDREPDLAGMAGFYLTGSIPEPFTNIRAIAALPAGAYAFVDRSGMSAPREYFSLAQLYAAQEHLAPPSQKTIREALLDSVRHHLVADVPVGAFLSAGIDSGALVGLMRDAGASRIQTVTISFGEFHGTEHDEGPLARLVAEHYETSHYERVVTEAEFRGDLSRIVDVMDLPSIDGVNTWFVSKAAREVGLKIAISGLGGDELFGGYPSFRDVPSWERKMSPLSRIPGLGFAIRNGMVAARASRWGISSKAAGMIEFGGSLAGAYLLRRGIFMPWELPAIMGREQAAEGLARLDLLNLMGKQIMPLPSTDFGRVATLESTLYLRHQLLRDTDWASMAHSLEVRVPLVDATLLRTLVPGNASGEGKIMLGRSPAKPLPEAVIQRSKTGFRTPVAGWAAGYGAKVKRHAHDSRSWARRVGSEQPGWK